MQRPAPRRRRPRPKPARSLQVRQPRGAELLIERQRIAQTLGEHLSLALANFRLREVMRQQSSRDPLTDLYNRRFMEESLYRELRRSARETGGIGVLMLDLDRFKALNDTYGHATGDVALRTIADFLKGAIRAEDIACRYGGEEFVVILPKASLADAVQRAEALRVGLRSIGDEPAVHVPTITISIGVAAFPDHGSTGDELLAAADRALYRAKAQGRDRVAVAEIGTTREIESSSARARTAGAPLDWSLVRSP
jgi:diguanylate cyclase (GGDEF)-like protein